MSIKSNKYNFYVLRVEADMAITHPKLIGARLSKYVSLLFAETVPPHRIEFLTVLKRTLIAALQIKIRE